MRKYDTILPELENLKPFRLLVLMTMAPFEANEAELNAIFQQANQLQKDYNVNSYPTCLLLI